MACVGEHKEWMIDETDWEEMNEYAEELVAGSPIMNQTSQFL